MAIGPGGATAAKSVYFEFGSAGTLGGQFSTAFFQEGPFGIAVNEAGSGGANPGDIYVVDRGNNRVQRFSRSGAFIGAWGKDVIAGGDGGYEICSVASECKAAAASAGLGGELSVPLGIAVDQVTGTVYVTDQSNRRVQAFSATGTFERAWGWDVIATGKPGDLGAASFEVCTVGVDCKIAGAAGESGGQFGFTVGYPAVDPDSGNVLVADATNRRVQEFTAAGAFVRLFGWDVVPTGKPGDTGANVFEICTSIGAGDCRAGQTTAPGNNPGQFVANTPTRVGIDSTGGIYTVENATSFRVQKFIPQAGPPALTPAVFGTAGAPNGNALADTPTDIAVGIGDHPFVVKGFAGGATASCPGGSPSVAERRVQELSPDGMTLLDTSLECVGINSINGLAADLASGRLYLASGTASPRVYVLADPPGLAPTPVTGGEGAGGADHLRTLEGTVDPEGFRLSECFFEYGLTDAYGLTTPCVPAPGELGEDDSPVSVAAETEALEPGATYHYRLVAANVAELGLGSDRTFTTSPAPPSSCPNAARRAEQGIAALLLPDCMALEQVSPPQKNNQAAKFPFVSANGERVGFFSTAPLGNTPGVLSLGGDPYVASRGVSSWSTTPTAPPAEFIRGQNKFPEAFSFAPDLSRWFQIASTLTQFDAGIGQAYSASLGGSFEPLSSLLVPTKGATGEVLEKLRLEGASANRSHLYFVVRTPADIYFADDPIPAGAGAGTNSYMAALDAGAPGLQLLARDAEGKVWGGRCGAALGSNRWPALGDPEKRAQGAVSADGSRVYFTTRPSLPEGSFCSESYKLRIMQREETSSGPEISELVENECTRVAPACSVADGDDRFQGASVDQARIYFTTSRQLSDSDLDATADLYLYEAGRPDGDRLTQVSAGGTSDATPGASAEVQGVVAISTDGSHAYFVARDVLTTDPNPSGVSAAAGQPNLYLYRSGAGDTSFLGTLAATDESGLWGSLSGFLNSAYPVPTAGQNESGNGVGGDGHVLLFESNAALTDEDVDGGRLDVFRYAAAASPTLECVSCRLGGQDGQPFDVAVTGDNRGVGVGTDYLERGRWVSDDGTAVTFMTAEPLVPGDVNGLTDNYLWRDGNMVRLPGRSYLKVQAGVQNAPVLSRDGEVVAFAVGDALLATDGDVTPDVYVARVGGGFAASSAGKECEGEACQDSPPPLPPAVTTATHEVTEGNARQRPPCRRGFVRRTGKCVKKPCRKGKIRRVGRCVKKAKSRKSRRGKRASARLVPAQRAINGDRRVVK